MYKIEYYKTKKKQVEPEMPLLDVNGDYEYLKDRLRKCEQYNLISKVNKVTWNIKSLTISKEDLEMLVYSDNSNLLVLLDEFKKLKGDYDGLRIPNSNFKYAKIIYELLCENWLLNEDEIDNIDEFKYDEIYYKVEDLKKVIEYYQENNPEILKRQPEIVNTKIRSEYMLSCINEKKKMDSNKIYSKVAKRK